MANLPEGIYQKPSAYTPDQISALQSILTRGQQNIQNPYAGFEPIRQAATTHFQQNIIPGITERFAKSGDNAPSSGVLQQQLGQAGAGLAERLAAMQSEFGQQQERTGLEQARLGLTPTQEYYTQESPWQNPLQSLAGGVASSIPGIAEIGLKKYLGLGQNQPGTQGNQQQGFGQTLGNIAGSLAPSAASAGLGSLSGLGTSLAAAGTAAAPFLLPAAIAAAIPLGIFGLYKLLED